MFEIKDIFAYFSENIIRLAMNQKMSLPEMQIDNWFRTTIQRDTIVLVNKDIETMVCFHDLEKTVKKSDCLIPPFRISGRCAILQIMQNPMS